MRLNETEVLVAGAGPIGMFTALLLAREGINVQVVDQATQVADQSYACALHGRSVKLLREAGLGDGLIKFGHQIDAVVFRESASRRAQIDLAEVTPSVPHLLTISQATLETLLEQKLNEAGVRVAWQRRLTDLHANSGGVTATIDELCGTGTGYDVPRWETVVNKTFQCSTKFVVGADGCHSVVRRLLGIDSEPFGRPELFVVYEFDSDAAETNQMTVVMNESDRNVFWPLPGQRCRWGFQWTDTEPDGEFRPKHRGGVWFEDQPIAARTREHLLQLLRTRALSFGGMVGEITWASCSSSRTWPSSLAGAAAGWSAMPRIRLVRWGYKA